MSVRDSEDEGAPAPKEPSREVAPRRPAGRPAGPDAKGGIERDWLAWLSQNAWVGVPMLVPIAIVVGMIQGAQAAILVLIGGALVTVIAFFWSSVRTLSGETPLAGADAFALAAPRPEEEQKQAVLRALNDLKFERSVGKISEEDYAELDAKYRAEAKRLLRILEEDARPRRERAEELVRERLIAAGLLARDAAHAYRSGPGAAAASAVADKTQPSVEGKKGKKKRKGVGKAPPSPFLTEAKAPPSPFLTEPSEREDEEDARVEIAPLDAPAPERPKVEITLKSGESTMKTKESPAYVPATKACAACGTKNDPDANFCKKCGSKEFRGAGTASEKALENKAAEGSGAGAADAKDGEAAKPAADAKEDGAVKPAADAKDGEAAKNDAGAEDPQ
jgi:ribosomal protein L40E